MNSDYENFLNRVKADLADIATNSANITEADIRESVQAMKDIYERRRNITISEEDTLEIINERTNDLFEMACDELESQLDQIDFNDITDTDFNIDLTRTEIDTISDMMKYKYMTHTYMQVNLINMADKVQK